VRVYRTPPYNSWDPSIVIFISFVVFFAMILSDAGYGLVMAALSLLFWRRMGRSEGGRLFRPLMLSLSVATIGYGALAGSYFGVTPAAESFLGRLHIIQIDDFDSMIHLSTIVGVLHIVMANMISAWQARRSPTALRPVGWVIAIVGGTLLYEQSVFASAPPWLSPVGTSMIGAGLALIILFASDRPLRPSPFKALFLRLVDGLLAATEVSKAFGDILSYLRLFALGLSSAYLAITFNEMAQGLIDSYQNMGIVAAIFILLLGHLLNFALCLMAGVVHGLRLNFIEFFNWSLTEDGYPFRPFLRKAG
jgi:V/A-type H+-transporting ATPase subunit I